MNIRSALNTKGQLWQAFPLGGPVREIEVGSTWIDVLGLSEIDLMMFDIPDETRRVRIFSSSEDIAGTVATSEQAAEAWPMRPGAWTLCTDRDLSGPRFFLAIDPRDTTAGVAETATVTIMEASR